METVEVKVQPSYQVKIEKGLLAQVGKEIAAKFPKARITVVTDDTVWGLWGTALEASLQAADRSFEVFSFTPGEGSKTLATVEGILTKLAQAQMTRSDILLAFGGGIVGDITGFSASIWLRGISFVQIPTTLLAAVDSSVGGKTGVNLLGIKNQVGSFHQPALVLCDPEVFSTLPPRTYADGMAEVIKYGVIYDRAFLESLMGEEEICHLVRRCVQMKADVVAEDERDLGARQLLNLGHTAAHAIEKRSGGSISHGHAVAMGMVLVTKAALRIGFCQEDLLPLLTSLLERYGLPTECPYAPEDLAPLMGNDKKRSGDRIHLILPKAAGDCRRYEVKQEDVLSLFREQEGDA